MKMKTEDILKKLEELEYYEIKDFIHSLELTNEQFEILSEKEDKWIKFDVARHPDLPESSMYKLADTGYAIVRWSIADRLDLPKDLMYKLTEDEEGDVRWSTAERSDLPEDLIIRLSCDTDSNTSDEGFEKFKELKNLKSEDLENAYDLIRTSKCIGRKQFEKTFDYIISNFPDLAEAAKLFKSIILKGKKDLK
jgi:hypothetical protein